MKKKIKYKKVVEHPNYWSVGLNPFMIMGYVCFSMFGFILLLQGFLFSIENPDNNPTLLILVIGLIFTMPTWIYRFIKKRKVYWMKA